MAADMRTAEAMAVTMSAPMTMSAAMAVTAATAATTVPAASGDCIARKHHRKHHKRNSYRAFGHGTLLSHADQTAA
jgi:hypothetical protein